MKALGVAILVVVILCGGYIMMLGGGPKMFLPPNHYAVAEDVSIVVNGQTYSAHEERNCWVTDQRGSIAVGSFHTVADGEPPYLLLPNKSAVVFVGVDPCRWSDVTPEVGTTTELTPSNDVHADWTKTLMGNAWYLDSTSAPSTARGMLLTELFAATGSWRLVKLSLTVIDTPKPSTDKILSDLPFLKSDARSTQFTTLSTASSPLLCKGTPTKVVDDWTANLTSYGVAGGCDARTFHHPGIKIDSSFTRADLDTAATDPLVYEIGIFTPAVMKQAAANGASQFRGDRPVWTTQICVEPQCFPLSTIYYKTLTLSSRSRNAKASVSVGEEYFSQYLQDSYF